MLITHVFHSVKRYENAYFTSIALWIYRHAARKITYTRTHFYVHLSRPDLKFRFVTSTLFVISHGCLFIPSSRHFLKPLTIGEKTSKKATRITNNQRERILALCCHFHINIHTTSRVAYSKMNFNLSLKFQRFIYLFLHCAVILLMAVVLYFFRFQSDNLISNLVN